MGFRRYGHGWGFRDSGSRASSASQTGDPTAQSGPASGRALPHRAAMRPQRKEWQALTW